MVRILITDLVSDADGVTEGEIIASALRSALASNDVIFLSFNGIGSASSSFISGALIPSLRSMTFAEFKRRVRIVDASWQVADVIKRRVHLELAAA
jgi:hypothetical protein